MKWFVFNAAARKNRPAHIRRYAVKGMVECLLGCIALPAAAAQGPDSLAQKKTLSRYERRVLRYKNGWANLIPDYSKLQFAGGMGVMSFGIGWAYGKNDQWETDLFLGVLPKFSGDEVHITLTLKENFLPWKIRLNGEDNYYRWMLEPFSVSLYINKIFGDGEFWTRQPNKYPDKYYILATNLRFNLAFGQRINVSVRNPRFANTVSFFYEVTTNDLYVICAVQNRTLKLHDIFSLSLGLRFQIL